MWGPCFLWGPQRCTTAPDVVTCLRHGLLLTVYTEVVKGHTLWHMYSADNAKTAILLQETDLQMVQLTCCTCLGAPERARAAV